MTEVRLPTIVTPPGVKGALSGLGGEVDRLAVRCRELEDALREACLHQGIPTDTAPERIAAHFRNNRAYREGWDALGGRGS